MLTASVMMSTIRSVKYECLLNINFMLKSHSTCVLLFLIGFEERCNLSIDVTLSFSNANVFSGTSENLICIDDSLSAPDL